MNGEIICVGTELLLGDILNTDAQFLAKELACLGINVFHQTTVGDNAARLKSMLAQAVTRSNLIILTGGLGPTKDDLTKETLASAIGLPLVEDEESLRRIEDYFRRTGRVMSENNRKQALVPKGAVVFQNDHGTAPGIAVTSKSQTIILLPGPPNELMPMFESYVKPFISKFSGATIVSHSIRLFGISESDAAQRLSPLFDRKNPTVAPYAKTGEVEIRVTASAENEEQADAMCRPVISEIRSIVGEYIYAVDVPSLQHQLINELRKSNRKIATAESCTAGLVSKKLTEVSGSSSVFDMGIVAYANSVKTNTLGVPEKIIDQYGAVSPQTAAGMAQGVRVASGADIGVSITGVAGPAESENKPVGLVYIAASDGKTVCCRKLMLGNGNGGDREKIREISAKSALYLALQVLQNKFGGGAEVPVKNIYSVGVFNHLMPPDKNPAGAAAMSKKATGSQNTLPDIKNDMKPVIRNEQDFYSSKKNQSVQPSDNQQQKLTASPVSAYKSESGDRKMNKQEKAKKKPWYRRLREYLFPCKGDKAGEVIRKIIFLIAIIAIICSGVYIVRYFINGVNNQQAIAEFRQSYNADDNTVNEESGSYIKFDSLLAMNSDTIGWLTVPDTNIDNPVFQNTSIGSTVFEKNEYYVHNNMFREKNSYGALFLDSAATFSQYSVSQNQVIYGHNMNDGSMFNNLRKYRDADFLLQHMVINYDTLYSLGQYKVFAVMVTNTVASDDNGYIFNYRMSDFESRSQFLEWIECCKARSIFICPVDINSSDEILTLSTCIYDFDDARLVVMARKVRDGESTDVDVSSVSVNPVPLYPQAWYNKKGGSKPVTGFSPSEFASAQ